MNSGDGRFVVVPTNFFRFGDRERRFRQRDWPLRRLIQVLPLSEAEARMAPNPQTARGCREIYQAVYQQTRSVVAAATLPEAAAPASRPCCRWSLRREVAAHE